MLTDEEHAALFAIQAPSTAQFWRRFGRQPDAAGKTVLDIGCGRGALCIYLAQQGADVLGIDRDEERIAWAQKNVAANHPKLSGKLRYEVGDAASLRASECFDLVVSKDTLEHVDDVQGIMAVIRSLLSPAGEAWLGFSPLYYSPYGDHRRAGLRVPWAHAVLPETILFAIVSRVKHRSVGSLGDLELNGLTPAQFRESARAADLDIQSISYNRGDRGLLRVMNGLRRITFLERYMTVSIYSVLVPADGV